MDKPHPTLKLLVLLQNAWAYERQQTRWSYNKWLCYLAACRTGIRLRSILGASAFRPLAGEPDYSLARAYLHQEGEPWCWFANTTDVIATGNRTLKPKPEHVAATIRTRMPHAVLSCGTQARDTIFHVGWGGPTVAMPHPAARFLSEKSGVFAEARRQLSAGGLDIGRVMIWQNRSGAVERSELPPIPEGRTRFFVAMLPGGGMETICEGDTISSRTP